MTYFLISTHGKVRLENFFDDFNKFHPNLKFTHESCRNNVTFSDLDAKLLNGQISDALHIQATDRHLSPLCVITSSPHQKVHIVQPGSAS